jgi:signal transduction histidine kinase
LNWKYTVPIIAIDGKHYGYYEVSGCLLDERWVIIGLAIQCLFLLMFLVIICFILYPIANSIPKKIFVDPINKLIYLLNKSDQNELDLFVAPREILLLRDRFIEILSKQNEILKKTEILKISEQVAHDIRSPLAAISMVISDVSSIPENKRLIIKNASIRIHDIANNLLFRSKDLALNENNLDESISLRA